MNESSESVQVPSGLEYLALERATTPVPRAAREMKWPPVTRDTPALNGAASRRLSKLAAQELQASAPTASRPDWSHGRAIPRLIISTRYEGFDAFGASQTLARLDLAARRAATLHRRLMRGDESKAWPEPMRTRQGGLRMLDARVGSFDAVMTVWGALVSIAGSTPVSVAGLIALAWDATRGTVHLANRWRGAPLGDIGKRLPSLELDGPGEAWGISHTKALAPVMSEAVASGQGFEFAIADGNQQIKLTVLPREE